MSTKQKPFLQTTVLLLCIFMLLSALCACAPAPDVPDTPLDPADPDVPKEPEEPSEPTEPENPTPAAQPQPENTFSPNSREAGTPFWRESAVPAAETDNGIVRFMLLTEKNAALPFNVACTIAEDRISAMLPAGIDLSAVTVNFTADSKLFLDGKRLTDGCVLDLTEPRALTVQTTRGETLIVTLDVQTLRTGLPSVALTVDEFATINSKEDYFTSTFYWGGGDTALCDYATDLGQIVGAQARGRGNSSWGFEKKSYTVKLAEKTDLLGLGRSRNWTLVSNYQDKSLMRNEIAAHLSDLFGLPTMNTRSVDLWLNGRYHGTYMLIEKVEIEKGRIDIPKYDEVSDPQKVGFLLEWDGHVQEISDSQKEKWEKVGNIVYDPTADTYFLPLNNSYVVIKKPSPSKILPEQLAHIEQLILQVNDAILRKDITQIRQYVDLESFAAWYLVEEIMKNMDSRFWSSCYMYVDGDGILHMGPVWDFDMSLGNANYGDVENPLGEYVSEVKWYKYLFGTEEFCELVATMLGNHAAELDAVTDYMDNYAAMLDRSQNYNFERWDILNRSVGWNPQSVIKADTYQKQVALIKDYYTTRLQYVRDSVAARCDPSAPAAVALPEGALSSPSTGTELWSGAKYIEDGRSLKFIIPLDSAVDLSAYAEDGVVCLTYWISSLDTLTSGHQLELTSSGTSDKGEFSWALSPARQMVAGSWQRLYLPISSAQELSGGVTPDWSNINFFRIYIHVGQTERFYISDLRVMHSYEAEN